MFKKNNVVNFLISIVLFCNYQIKAMDESPNMAASSSNEIKLDENSSGALSCLTVFDDNKEYCNILKQLPEKLMGKKLHTNEEDLQEYRDLLDKVFCKQDINFDEMVSAFSVYFQAVIDCNEELFDPLENYRGKKRTRFVGIRLEEINIILKALVGLSLDSEEIDKLNKILLLIFVYRDFDACRSLRYFLANNGLYPSLISIDKKNSETFFMYLANKNHIDIKLFSLIINNAKKNTIYDLVDILMMRDTQGSTVLHYAVNSGSKEKVEMILELMREQNLCPMHFINWKNKLSITPLMIARNNDYCEIISLFVHYIEKDLVTRANQPINLLKFTKTDDECGKGKLISSSFIDEGQDNNCDILVRKIEDHCTKKKTELEKHLSTTKLNGLMMLPMISQLDRNELLLAEYKQLLYEILNIQSINLNQLLFYLDDVTGHLREINAMVKILIKQSGYKSDIVLSLYEQAILTKWIEDTFIGYGIWSLRFFLANNNLYPRLDKIIDVNQKNYFMKLISDDSAGTFKIIISKARNEKYRWKDLFKMSDMGGNTVLHYAAQNANKDTIEIILNLIRDKNLDLENFINLRNNEGKTPLMLAAAKGYLEIIYLLVDCGAKVHLHSKEGYTALKYMLMSRKKYIKKAEEGRSGELKPTNDYLFLRCLQLLS